MIVNQIKKQKSTCEKFGANYTACLPASILGIARNVGTGIQPINGFRHFEEGNTNGWYIYAGEMLSADADFFKPLHVEHLEEMSPEVIKYLALPPGWRFLITSEGYEDVWFDPTLLKTVN